MGPANFSLMWGALERKSSFEVQATVLSCEIIYIITKEEHLKTGNKYNLRPPEIMVTVD